VDGEYLLRQGEPGTDVLYILDGEAEVLFRPQYSPPAAGECRAMEVSSGRGVQPALLEVRGPLLVCLSGQCRATRRAHCLCVCLASAGRRVVPIACLFVWPVPGDAAPVRLWVRHLQGLPHAAKHLR
jgi:hypothetical protein